ncbi:hypothetical protein WDU94_012437 [Cyamophila willieti]
MDKLWSQLMDRQDFGAALDDHIHQSDWSVYNEFVSARFTYSMCVCAPTTNPPATCLVHDAVLVMIGSRLEKRLLETFFVEYITRKAQADMVVTMILAQWPVKDLFRRLFIAPLVACRIRTVLRGCYITNGVVYYGMFREINNNLKCHSIVSTENVIMFYYENNRGGAHKIFTKYAPNTESLVSYYQTIAADTRPSCAIDWDAFMAHRAYIENELHFNNPKCQGDESKCVFGQLYWRDSKGHVLAVTREVFDTLYTTRCLDQRNDLSDPSNSISGVDYERNYERWRKRTFEYCLSTSVQMVHVDDVKNKAYVAYSDALAQMLDKEPVHTNPLFWKSVVQRGLILSSMSKTLSAEADPLTKRQTYNRADRQTFVNSKCNNLSSSSSSGGAGGGSRPGGGGSAFGKRCEDRGGSPTISVPTIKKDSVVQIIADSNQSILNTILHATSLVRYNIAGFQRSKQKSSSNVHVVKKNPTDSFGYTDNVNTGIMAAAGKRSFLTSKCIRSYGFVGNHYEHKLRAARVLDSIPCVNNCGGSELLGTYTTVHFLVNNRLLKRTVTLTHFLSTPDDDVIGTPLARWFAYTVLIPVKRVVPYAEVQLIPNVVDTNGDHLFVNILFTNGVLELQLPMKDFFCSWLDVGDGDCLLLSSSSSSSSSSEETIALSRFELESLVWVSRAHLMSQFFDSKLVDQGRDLYSLDKLRCTLQETRAQVVLLTNKLVLDYYDRRYGTFPKSALINDMFTPTTLYNDSKRSQCGANCSKTAAASIDHLDTSRLLNAVLQFFTAPNYVCRTTTTTTTTTTTRSSGLDTALMRTSLPPFSRENFYLLKCGFGNVNGLNVEDAIVINRRVDLNLHALFKIIVRIKISVASEHRHFLDSNMSVTLPRWVQSRAFDPSWSRAPPKQYTGGLFTIIKRDRLTRKPLVLLVPVAEIFCDRQDYVEIVFDQYPKYIVERYGGPDGTRYQIYKMFDDVFLLDIVHGYELSRGAQMTSDLGDRIQLLRHDDTVIQQQTTQTNGTNCAGGGGLDVFQHVIRLEFVTRMPHFDGMKLGNEWAEKGMCVVRDLSQFFSRPEDEPDVVFNITSVVSRATSGQYFNMMKNMGRFVVTADGHRMFVGHVPCFQMITYIASLMSTIRACVPLQYALLANKLVVSYQQLRSNDIMNQTGRVMPPNVEKIFKLYSPLGCLFEWFVDNRGRKSRPSVDPINTTRFLDENGYRAICQKYDEFETISKQLRTATTTATSSVTTRRAKRRVRPRHKQTTTSSVTTRRAKRRVRSRHKTNDDETQKKMK